jgi:MFS family permease
MSRSSTRRRLTICIILIGLLDAIVYGLHFPLFAVTLERNGLAPSLIGLSTTFASLGALLCGAQFPRMIRRLGYRGFTVAAFFGALVASMGLLLSEQVGLWFMLRLVLCISLAGLWVSTDAWLSETVLNSHRGRVTGVFQALYCFGFFIGPSVTYLTGYTGYLPILAMATLCIGALIVLCFAYDSEKGSQQPDEPVRWRDFHRIRGTLVVLSLAALVGICETAVYTLMPIYGIHRGLETGPAVDVLVAYTLGEAVIALPVGWLADRVNRERILAISAVIASSCFFLLIVTIRHGLYAEGAAFFAGGFVASLFNTSIVLIGQCFDSRVLPTVMTAFTMSYSLGSAGGPAIGGGLMDLFGPTGLPIFLGAVLALSGLTLFAQTVARSRPSTLPPIASNPANASLP